MIIKNIYIEEIKQGSGLGGATKTPRTDLGEVIVNPDRSQHGVIDMAYTYNLEKGSGSFMFQYKTTSAASGISYLFADEKESNCDLSRFYLSIEFIDSDNSEATKLTKYLFCRQ